MKRGICTVVSKKWLHLGIFFIKQVRKFHPNIPIEVYSPDNITIDLPGVTVVWCDFKLLFGSIKSTCCYLQSLPVLHTEFDYFIYSDVDILMRKSFDDFLALADSGLCGIVKSTYGAKRFFNGIYSSPKNSFLTAWSDIQKNFASGIAPMQKFITDNMGKCKILSGDNCVPCFINEDTKLRPVIYHLGTGDNSVWDRKHIAIIEYQKQIKCKKLTKV